MTSENPAQQPLPQSETTREFAIERYKYILNQIHSINENTYRFLAIYQGLTTTIVGAALALFVGYKKWQIKPSVARSGLLSLMLLETLLAAFISLLIIIGIAAWFDYRKEECELTETFAGIGFRKAPRLGSFFRWYETYIVAFISLATASLWAYTILILLPAMKLSQILLTSIFRTAPCVAKGLRRTLAIAW